MIKEFELQNIDGKINIIDYLTESMGLTTRKSKMLIKERKVTINGKAGYWDSKLKNGDRIAIDLVETVKEDIVPQPIPLDIIYEDSYLLAVSKPAFMLVHPTQNHQEGTLANGIAYYFSCNGVTANVRLLNRLDMNTSGVVLIPKTSELHGLLGKQMSEGKIRKEYIAVIEGRMAPERGSIDLPLGPDPSDPIKRAVMKDGQQAVTEYCTVGELKGASILTLRLLTGRTHQIRVHLSYMGHPILGDTLYGRESSLISRQALHAQEMELIHPMTDETVILKAKLPDDIEKLIDGLKQGY